MKELFRKLDNISIKRKFLIVYVICVFISIVVSTIVWGAFTTKEMQDNELHYLSKTFEEASQDFYFLMQNGINIGKLISKDEVLLKDLSIPTSSDENQYAIYFQHLRNRFNMYLASNSDVAEVTFYMNNFHFLNYDYFRNIDEDVRQKEWFHQAQNMKSDFIIYPFSTAISIVPYQNRFTVIYKVQKENFLENTVNYILVEMKLDRIIHAIDQKKESSVTYLTAPNGAVLWRPNQESETRQLPSDDKYFIIRKAIGNEPAFAGYEFVGVYDKNILFFKQIKVLFLILLITLFFSGISILIIGMFLNSMRYRIYALTAHMKAVDNENFGPLVLNSYGEDEIGWLIRSFNDMIYEINQLVNVVLKLDMQKKSMEVENIRAQYQYLQAQVDPHFLFNTLNAILVFCLKNEYTELSDVILNLSRLLKRLLTSGEELVSVSEEFDFIEKYLLIEKFRFGDKFSFQIHISNEVYASGIKIPKMSIQPIVENACKHGLQSSGANRMLLLSAEIKEQSLIITTSDNGVGIEKEKVLKIVRRMKSKKEEDGVGISSPNGEGIGMQNVYRRMKINYGDRFHFHIHSELGKGTEIILVIEGE